MSKRMVGRQWGSVWKLINKTTITVSESITAGIVWRIEVNNVNLIPVRVVQTCQRMVVVAFYQDMCRFSVIVVYSQFGHFFQHGNTVLAFLLECLWHVYPRQAKAFLL